MAIKSDHVNMLLVTSSSWGESKTTMQLPNRTDHYSLSLPCLPRSPLPVSLNIPS